MSVDLFSDKEISIVANFAERINLGDAQHLGHLLAQQNVNAFNSRYSNFEEKVNFKLVSNTEALVDNSLTSVVYDLIVNSYTDQKNSHACLLLSRILKNTIAIEFGEQEFHGTIGKQCRVKHTYNRINYVVAEQRHGLRIASFDEVRNCFRLFNAHKEAVTLLGCNQLSLQQVSSLIYRIEKPILDEQCVLIENNTLKAFKDNPEDVFTIEFKVSADEQMIKLLKKFNAHCLRDNIWQVSSNIISVLRELCPRGSVYV